MFFDKILHIFNYSLHCASAPFHASGCRDLWFFSSLVYITIIFLIISGLVSGLFSGRSLLSAYRKRKFERARLADDR